MFFLQSYQKMKYHLSISKKKKQSPFLNITIDNDDSLRNRQVTMTKEKAYISKKSQLKHHSLAFSHKNKSLVSATIFLSLSLVC